MRRQRKFCVRSQGNLRPPQAQFKFRHTTSLPGLSSTNCICLAPQTGNHLPMSKLLSLAALFLACVVNAAPIRVVVWDEQAANSKKAYTNFLGNHIAVY